MLSSPHAPATDGNLHPSMLSVCLHVSLLPAVDARLVGRPLCLPVHLSIRPTRESINSPVCPSVGVRTHPSVRPPHPSVRLLCAYPSICPSAPPSVHPFTRLSVWQCASLPAYQPACPQLLLLLHERPLLKRGSYLWSESPILHVKQDNCVLLVPVMHCMAATGALAQPDAS
jgi:hypothetical protein